MPSRSPSPVVTGFGNSYRKERASFALVGGPAFRVEPAVSAEAGPGVTVEFADGVCANDDIGLFKLQAKLSLDGGAQVIREIAMSPGTKTSCPAAAVVCE